MPGKAKGYIKGTANACLLPWCLPALSLSSTAPKQRIKTIFIIHHFQTPSPQMIPFPHIHAPSLYVHTHSAPSQPLIPKYPQNPGSLSLFSFVLITWHHLPPPFPTVIAYLTQSLQEAPAPPPYLQPHLLLFTLLHSLLATLACLLFLKHKEEQAGQCCHLPTFGPLFWLLLLLRMFFLRQPHGLLPSLVAFISSQSFFPTSFFFALITI